MVKIEKIEAEDITTWIIILGVLFLIALGHNSMLVNIFGAVVAGWFGIKQVRKRINRSEEENGGGL